MHLCLNAASQLLRLRDPRPGCLQRANAAREGFSTPTEVVDLAQCLASLHVSRWPRAHCFQMQVSHKDGSHKDVLVSVDSNEEVCLWLKHMRNHIEIVKTGWITKQRRWMSAFHDPRWCVLTKSTMHLFRKQTLDFREPAEVLDLSHIQACTPHSTDPYGLLVFHSSQENCILLTLSSAVEVQEWLDCIWNLGVARTTQTEASGLSGKSQDRRHRNATKAPPSKSHDTSAFSFCMILVLLVYILSPIDLLPDFLPIIGWVDDAIAGGFLLFFGSRMASKAAKECEC